MKITPSLAKKLSDAIRVNWLFCIKWSSAQQWTDTLVSMNPLWFSSWSAVPFRVLSFCSSFSAPRLWQFWSNWPLRARSHRGSPAIVAVSRRADRHRRRPTTRRAAAAEQPRPLTGWSTSGTARAPDPDPRRTESGGIPVRKTASPSNGWKAVPPSAAQTLSGPQPSFQIAKTPALLTVSSHYPPASVR